METALCGPSDFTGNQARRVDAIATSGSISKQSLSSLLVLQWVTTVRRHTTLSRPHHIRKLPVRPILDKPAAAPHRHRPLSPQWLDCLPADTASSPKPTKNCLRIGVDFANDLRRRLNLADQCSAVTGPHGKGCDLACCVRRRRVGVIADDVTARLGSSNHLALARPLSARRRRWQIWVY